MAASVSAGQLEATVPAARPASGTGLRQASHLAPQCEPGNGTVNGRPGAGWQCLPVASPAMGDGPVAKVSCPIALSKRGSGPGGWRQTFGGRSCRRASRGLRSCLRVTVQRLRRTWQ
jgi:hypothetical protein